MMRPISPRPFRREDNRLTIYLWADQWTSDVPLPPESRMEYVGENREIPIYPKMIFVLEPETTRQVIVGYYVIPMPFAESIEWFQRELNQIGWESDSESGYRKQERALLHFQHPDSHAKVQINLKWWPHRIQCTALIQREVVDIYEKINLDELMQDSPDLEIAPSSP